MTDDMIREMFPYVDEPTLEKIKKTALDMAISYLSSYGEALEALRKAMAPFETGITALITSLIEIDSIRLTRSELRWRKLERRRERNSFLVHGKHGLKRPKGRG